VVARTFTELVEEVRPRLERAFYAAYGPQRGEEAAAEAMAWAWEHQARLQAMDNPAGYLYRVGQSRTRSSRVVQLSDFPEPVDLGLIELEPKLPAALLDLTERQRTCVALVVGHHWTFDEAAEVLEISRSSVQSHVERGMARLRAQLGATLDAES
jgi:RNA polymerase sigma-70 factor (ECF subfamily)